MWAGPAQPPPVAVVTAAGGAGAGASLGALLARGARCHSPSTRPGTARQPPDGLAAPRRPDKLPMAMQPPYGAVAATVGTTVADSAIGEPRQRLWLAGVQLMVGGKGCESEVEPLCFAAVGSCQFHTTEQTAAFSAQAAARLCTRLPSRARGRPSGFHTSRASGTPPSATKGWRLQGREPSAASSCVCTVEGNGGAAGGLHSTS